MFLNWDGQWIAFVSDDDSRWGPGRCYHDASDRLAYHGQMARILENQMPQIRTLSEEEKNEFYENLDESVNAWLRPHEWSASDVASTASDRSTLSQHNARVAREAELERIADEKKRGMRVDFIELAWKRHLEARRGRRSVVVEQKFLRHGKEIDMTKLEQKFPQFSRDFPLSVGPGSVLSPVKERPDEEGAVSSPEKARSSVKTGDDREESGLAQLLSKKSVFAGTSFAETSSSSASKSSASTTQRVTVTIGFHSTSSSSMFGGAAAGGGGGRSSPGGESVTSRLSLEEQEQREKALKRKRRLAEKKRQAQEETRNRAVLSEKRALRAGKRAFLEAAARDDEEKERKKNAVVNPLAEYGDYEREIMKWSLLGRNALEYKQKYPEVFTAMSRNLVSYFRDARRQAFFTSGKRNTRENNVDFSNAVLSKARKDLGPKTKDRAKLSMRAAAMVIKDQMMDVKSIRELQEEKQHEAQMLKRMTELNITCESHRVPFLQDESGPRATPPDWPGPKQDYPGLNMGAEILGPEFRDRLLATKKPDHVLERKADRMLARLERDERQRRAARAGRGKRSQSEARVGSGVSSTSRRAAGNEQRPGDEEGPRGRRPRGAERGQKRRGRSQLHATGATLGADGGIDAGPTSTSRSVRFVAATASGDENTSTQAPHAARLASGSATEAESSGESEYQINDPYHSSTFSPADADFGGGGGSAAFGFDAAEREYEIREYGIPEDEHGSGTTPASEEEKEELTLPEVRRLISNRVHRLRELRLPLVRNIMSGVLPTFGESEDPPWRPGEDTEQFQPDFPSSLLKLTFSPLRRAWDIGISTTARRDDV
eukprot:g10840.t1